MQRTLRSVSWLLCVSGLVAIVAGWGGQWGIAYGQTAGPTPTAPAGISPLVATMVADRSAAGRGEQVTFTIQVRNPNTVARPNVVISDTVPDFLEIISAVTTKGTVTILSTNTMVTINGQHVKIAVGDLAAGETVTVTIIVRVRQSAADNTTGTNVAQVTVNGETANVASTNPVAITVSSSATPPGSGPPSGLPNTGAASATNPSLFGLGIILVALGIAVFVYDRRRTHSA